MWLVSRKFDIALVAGPLAVAFLALLFWQRLGIGEPLWAYLLFFVSFDVAHVWATGFLTYFDKAAFAERRLLFTAPIFLFFVLAAAVHFVSETWFWTAIAYFAIFHFVRQQYGFIAIYRVLAGEKEGALLDKIAIYTGAIGPVLLWHAEPRGQFDWWQNGERFLFHLPTSANVLIYIIMAVVFVFWLAKQRRPVNLGKMLWMVGTWVSWYVGLRYADNLLVSAAFLNLFHGLPFLVLVWLRGQERARMHPQRKISAWFQPGKWIYYYGVLVALAAAEELLWDGLVWHSYLGAIDLTLSHSAKALLVALLVTPQLVHYFLDGVLWKNTPHNQDFRTMLERARARN